MKTRMDKYIKENVDIPKRESKNSFLYDEIYDEKKEPTSNITLIDNVHEIDINKIKEMMNSRETYKKSRDYKNIIGDTPLKRETKEFDYKEPEEKDYDINEMIRKKKDGVEEEEKIRKISQTQYDILKGLTINSKESDFFSKEKDLTDLIGKIHNDDDKTIDLFGELKAKEENDATPEIITKQLNIKKLENTFEFEKGDFDDLNISSKGDRSFTIKIVLIFIISIVVLIGIFYLITQYSSNA